MKIVARVGSESHTSSRAGCSLQGAYGKPLPGKLQPDAEHSGVNARYFLVEVDLAPGTRLRYSGSGADGPRGCNRYSFDRTYIVGTEEDPVIEETPDLGPVQGLLKGRLRFVRDLAQEKAQGLRIDATSGF